MKEELKKLSRLQEVDVEIDQLKYEYESIPVQVENKKSEIEQKKKKLEEEKAKVKELQVNRKSLEIDLGSSEEKIKKQRLDLNSIKTNEQYKALLREIERAENEKSAIEDNILKVMGEIDEFNARIIEFERTSKNEETGIQEEITGLLSQKIACEQKLNEKTAERANILPGIPAPILKKYEHIKNNMGDGVALAPILGNNCGVCGMKLPAQVMNEVSKDKSLVFCENCSRILYLPNGLLNENAGEGRKAAPRENRGEESPNSRAGESEISPVKG